MFTHPIQGFLEFGAKLPAETWALLLVALQSLAELGLGVDREKLHG